MNIRLWWSQRRQRIQSEREAIAQAAEKKLQENEAKLSELAKKVRVSLGNMGFSCCDRMNWNKTREVAMIIVRYEKQFFMANVTINGAIVLERI